VFTVEQTPQFRGWFAGVTDPVAHAAIATRIVRIEAGLLGDVKSVGDKVSELRIDVGRGYRVYFTRRRRTIVLLLSGGDKGDQARSMRAAKDMVAELDKQEKAAAATAKKKGGKKKS
jgi:putative addiction module killer protein